MDQEMKKKKEVTCGSHTNKKKTRIRGSEEADGHSSVGRKIFLLFIFLFSLASLFDIRKSDRQDSSGEEAKCSTQ